MAKPVEQRPAEEVKLDKWIRKELRKGPEDYSPHVWRTVREQMRLIALYTGKCVAFRDHYERDAEGRQWLIQREILRVSRSMMVIVRFVASLPEEEQRDVLMDYIDRPEELLQDMGRRL
jgi:hypothetical protein